MAAEDEPPTLTQIEIIRNEVKDRVSQEALDVYDERDLDVLMKNNFYVSRFWIHAFFIPGNRIENTVNLVLGTFKWRKEFGVNDISEADLDQELLERGSLYYHNRDKMGCKLLMFCIRKHGRDAKKTEEMKKMLIYILERLDREEAGKRITIIFDSEAAGLANFDLELVKFLIHVLISFYPNFVNKILVFEMPWILNTAWKIIKSLLPPPAVARIKFVSKANIKSLISESNLPLAWGGEDDWEYDWRSFLGDTSSAPLDSPGGYKLSPVSVLKFVPSSSSSVLESCLTLTNTTDQHMALKVKTTQPDLFRVRPHLHCLAPQEQLRVVIQTEGTSILTVSSQQFQILISKTQDMIDKDRLYSFFMDKSIPQEKVVLRCEVEGVRTEDSNNRVNMNRVLTSKVDTLEDKIESLYKVLAIQVAIVSLVIFYKMIFA